MNEKAVRVPLSRLTKFNRQFFDSDENFTYIGGGELGGKAQGLASTKCILESEFDYTAIPQVEVSIPTLTVITTDMFDAFIQRNNLYEIAYSDARDDQIALAFQKASLPAELVGDLRALIAMVHSPLAVRSSSLAEDALHEPFAGVYATKMIPNNQHDTDTRFKILVEAIKYVYASTFFKSAKSYMEATNKSITTEKMSAIIQEVVGCRFGDRYYPHVSGVGRSYNFYPSGHAAPEDGVIDLALGLGKTVVDGGKCWIYSPSYPKTNPPHGSIGDLLKQTQTSFWAVNMGKPPAHDPIKETEYMVMGNLQDAENDGTLRFIASTYNRERDRIVVGVGTTGARVLTVAPALLANEIPLNDIIKTILKLCEDKIGSEVEIEFAVTLDRQRGLPARFGLLQVRPMFVSHAKVEVTPEELTDEKVLIASKKVLGNGIDQTITDVVYVKPETFDAKNTRTIATELSLLNKKLVAANRRYLLIIFGRLGSADPWLGIPVDWAQVSGARVIVESTLPNMNVDFSQGAHFFHNVISFQVFYFSIHHSGKLPINWEWFNKQQLVTETKFTRQVQLNSPLTVKVDGRNGRGVILS